MDIQQVMAEVHRPHCSDCDYDIRCDGPISGCDCPCHPDYPESAMLSMKALSIQQPHADEILFAGKDIENRSWKLPAYMVGQRIYIHAGKKPRAGYHGSPKRLGAILGEVTITGCVTKSGSEWFEGPYGFVLKDPIAYNSPRPCRGRLGFFEVD